MLNNQSNYRRFNWDTVRDRAPLLLAGTVSSAVVCYAMARYLEISPIFGDDFSSTALTAMRGVYLGASGLLPACASLTLIYRRDFRYLVTLPLQLTVLIMFCASVNAADSGVSGVSFFPILIAAVAVVIALIPQRSILAAFGLDHRRSARGNPRVDLTTGIHVSDLNGQRKINMVTENVSERGLCVYGSREAISETFGCLRVGDKLVVRIRHKKISVSVEGTIAWESAEGPLQKLGLRFQETALRDIYQHAAARPQPLRLVA